MGASGNGTPAIECNELTKRYGALVAVDRLSLRVQQAEIFGFLGPNGAGKSTTMRMLLGLVKPSGGTARVLGMEIGSQMPDILARTGSLIENPTFYPFLSGQDNLRVAARISGTGDDRIESLLELVELKEAAGRRFKTYSLGMKQRLAVAAALLTEPDLLILDEPANGLDPAGIVEMREMLKRIRDEGHTIFISSHVLHEIEQICDRIAILNRGQIVVEGRVHDLLGRRGRIEIRIDRSGEAQALLGRVSWIDDVSREGDRLLVAAPFERSAEINALLAKEGLYAAEIRRQEQSLEQYFLTVTEDRQQ